MNYVPIFQKRIYLPVVFYCVWKVYGDIWWMKIYTYFYTYFNNHEYAYTRSFFLNYTSKEIIMCV